MDRQPLTLKPALWALVLGFVSPGIQGAGPVALAQGAENRRELPLVDRSIAFHGGRLYEASETELELCSLSGCTELAVLVDGSRFVYTATDPSGSRTRITNRTVERWENGEAVSVDPKREQRFRDRVMSRVYFAFLPYRLNDPSVLKSDLGTETWEGRTLRKVKVRFEPGSSTDANDEYLYWLDPETARVEQFAYSFQGNPGGLRLRLCKNYRRVGGILFFDQENLGAEGEGLVVDQITPAFVAEKMRHVSTVTLKNIRVRPLGND